MQQSKRKLMLEHVIVEKMGAGADLRQDELDDLLRYGAAELFADAATGMHTDLAQLHSSLLHWEACLLTVPVCSCRV